MFRNLKAEMERKNVQKEDLEKDLRICRKTLNERFSGKRDWQSKEMKIIQKKYFPYMTLDELFETEDSIDQKETS